jgi:protoheme ferro-lyase
MEPTQRNSSRTKYISSRCIESIEDKTSRIKVNEPIGDIADVCPFFLPNVFREEKLVDMHLSLIQRYLQTVQASIDPFLDDHSIPQDQLKQDSRTHHE